MTIKIILAVDKNWGIGFKGKLPWSISEDLKFFSQQTKNHSVVMGKNTYKCIGNRPLPNRKNYVLTKSKINEVETITNIEKLLEKYKNSDKTLFIIGGKRLFEEYLDFVDEIIISNISGDYDTDIKIDPSILKKYKKQKDKLISDRVTVNFYR